VSRKDTNVIAFLTSAKTDSYAVVSGSLREIAYRDYDQIWLLSTPAFITFLVSSIFAVSEDGTTGIETKSTYPSDLSITRTLNAAAADAYARDRDAREETKAKFMQRAFDAVK
jgi:hypothetical protein